MPGDELILTFLPSLVETLLKREKSKGAPLTEEEVLALCAGAPTVALTPEAAAAAEKERGYADIDAEDCWHDWQRARLQFLDSQ